MSNDQINTRLVGLMHYMREMHDLDFDAWHQCFDYYWADLFADGFDDDEVLSIAMDGYGVAS